MQHIKQQLNHNHPPPNQSITPKQQTILRLLYRFRFLNRLHIQQYLSHTNHKRIILWLNDLTTNHLPPKLPLPYPRSLKSPLPCSKCISFNPRDNGRNSGLYGQKTDPRRNLWFEPCFRPKYCWGKNRREPGTTMGGLAGCPWKRQQILKKSGTGVLIRLGSNLFYRTHLILTRVVSCIERPELVDSWYE